MKYLISLLSLLILSLAFPVWSKEKPKAKGTQSEKQITHEGHTEDEEKNHEGKKEEHAHGANEKGHDEGEHGHEEAEEGSNVGPDKGILEANEEEGIKLSPEALKNFEIKTTRLAGLGPWTLPSSARLLSGEESNLYRLRNGSFKRIDFILVKKTPEQIIVNSNELKPGDEVVTGGIGFLRIAELTAFGGAPEGHSH